MRRKTTSFKWICCISCLFLLFQHASAQNNIKATGKIIDSKENTVLSGATIALDGGTVSTLADQNGRFEISVPAGSRLRISMVGFETQIVNAKTGLTIEMVTAAANLGDVVVIGYGTQKKELLTGSVVNMKFTETEKEIPTTMVGNLLAGKLAGVSIGTPNGLPGQSAPSITIRTPNSFNSQPVLFVIDGKIMGSGDFNNLSPNEIESISVLKDAASAAVYGSRAAGGVVVVTTKKGKAGRPVIQYSYNTGFDKRAKNIPLTSAVEAGKLYSQINPTSDPAGWAWTQSDLDYFQTINNGWGYDQLHDVWRDPSTSTHNLSLSGGSEKIKYFVGGSYVKQKGFLDNLRYDKYNLRANISGDLTKNLQFFAGVTLNSNLTYSTTSTAVGDPSGIYAKLLVWQPDQPVWTNTNKAIDYGWIANVGAETRGDGGYINSAMLKPVINLSATYKVPVIPGLSATAAFSKSYADNRTKIFQKQYNMYVMQKQGLHIINTNDTGIVSTKLSSQVSPSILENRVTWSEDKQLNLQLNYERIFNNVHHVKAWLIYESYEAKGSGVDAWINGFPVYTTDQWWAANTQSVNQFVSNSTNYSDYISGRKSWVGQFFYDYSSKYLATFSYRYDGSMNFAPDQRWGFFPSGSLGWIVSKESFFKVRGIDMLKIRASAGVIGNDVIGGWQWQDAYKTGTSAFFGTTPSTNVGVTYGTVSNPNLTWEKSLNKNIGIDINFLKHFSATAEYWRTNTYDILGTRIQSVPPTFSLPLPALNYGKENAEGIDLSVGYSGNINKVNFSTSVVASYGNAWYIVRDEAPTYDWQKSVGRSTSKLTGYKVDQIIRTQADLNTLTAATPGYKFNGIVPALGQFKYIDLGSASGKDTKDGLVDNWDQTILRKNNNPIVLGWNIDANWKAFSISAGFNGMIRQWKSINDLTGGVEWNRVWNQWYSDSWTPTNTNASLPKRYSANDGTRSVFQSGSDFWYKDASFFRLKSLAIGYSLPFKYSSRLGVQGVKFYVSGSNLFIISKFNKDYYDPEMASGTAFPIMKSFNFGCTLSL